MGIWSRARHGRRHDAVDDAMACGRLATLRGDADESDAWRTPESSGIAKPLCGIRDAAMGPVRGNAGYGLFSGYGLRLESDGVTGNGRDAVDDAGMGNGRDTWCAKDGDDANDTHCGPVGSAASAALMPEGKETSACAYGDGIDAVSDAKRGDGAMRGVGVADGDGTVDGGMGDDDIAVDDDAAASKVGALSDDGIMSADAGGMDGRVDRSAMVGQVVRGNRSDDVAASMLSRLSGVRGEDGRGERRHTARTVPRVRYGPVQALAAILLLAAALCASLTMLIRQSINYASSTSVSAGGEAHSESMLDATADDVGVHIGDGAGDGGGDAVGNGAGDGTDGAAGDMDESPGAGARPSSGSEHANGQGAGTQGASDGVGPSTQEEDALLDLNTATVAQLDLLKGVGPVTAGNIIAYRARIGRFTSVDQLLEVKGIGAKTLEKLRPQVRVS